MSERNMPMIKLGGAPSNSDNFTGSVTAATAWKPPAFTRARTGTTSTHMIVIKICWMLSVTATLESPPLTESRMMITPPRMMPVRNEHRPNSCAMVPQATNCPATCPIR